LALACLALLGPSAGAQSVTTGFLDRLATVEGKGFLYQVYVPAQYSQATSWPVILFLHGSGERGSEGLLQTTVGLGPAIRRDGARFPALVVFPQAPAGAAWAGATAEMAMTALRQTLKEFHGDPDRVYLTGLSLGGRGTWYLAYRHPGVFAAVAPVCGWVVDPPQFKDGDPVVPPQDGAPLQALARRLGTTPVWIFHGEMDSLVPVEASRKPAATLRDLGADVQYTEFLGLGHNCWDAAYGSRAFLEWLFAQRRKVSAKFEK
jgi:predicted peptidase